MAIRLRLGGKGDCVVPGYIGAVSNNSGHAARSPRSRPFAVHAFGSRSIVQKGGYGSRPSAGPAAREALSGNHRHPVEERRTTAAKGEGFDRTVEHLGMGYTRRTISTLLQVTVLSALIVACSTNSGRGHPGASVDTLASGIISVTNSSTPRWPEGEGWRVEEEYRLGSIDEDGPEIFARIRGLEVDALGRTWVFEEQAQEIRVFDEKGDFVRTIGREGEGPGEFLEVTGVAWAPDATLWVLDPGNLRISVFDTAGSLVGTHPFDLSYRYFPWPGTIDGEGSLYKLQRTAPLPNMETVLVRYDASLAPTDTLLVPVHPRGPQRWVHSSGGGTTTLRIPFAGDAIWRVTQDGGMWVAITDEYRLIRLGPNGDTLRTVSKPFHRLPVTRHEVDSLLSRMERYRSSIDRSQVPSFKPPIQNFLLDDEENVWVFPLSEGEYAGRSAEIFSPVGSFLGTVFLPYSPRWYPRPVIRENQMVGVTMDSLRVPYVVRATIRKPGIAGG